MEDANSLKKKLASYSAMAGAMLAANHHNADAQVIYHDIVPDTFITDQNLSYYLDMNNDGINDFWLNVHDTSELRFYVNEGNHCMEDVGLDFDYLAAFGNCRVISQNSDTYNGYLWRPANSGTTSYLGMFILWSFGAGDGHWYSGPYSALHKFAPVILHLTDGNHYGWIRMTHYVGIDTLFIEDYAYEAIPDSAIVTPCPTEVKNISSPNLFNEFTQNHQLILHFQQSPLPSRMILLNEVGMKINEQAITQSELVMDVSDLAAGIYFVEVIDGDRRETKKVIIQ